MSTRENIRLIARTPLSGAYIVATIYVYAETHARKFTYGMIIHVSQL